MKKITKKLLLILFVLPAFVTSCYNDVELDKIEREIQIDQALVTPIGIASISAEEFITRLDSTNNIYITSEGEIRMEMDDEFEISLRDVDLLSYAEPIDFSGNIVTEEDIIPPGQTSSYNIDDEFIWDFGVNTNIEKERIDRAAIEVLILDAVLNVNNLNVNANDIKVILNFKNHITDMDNQEYIFEYSFNSFNTAHELNLPPVIIDYRTDGVAINTIPVNVELMITNSGSNDLIVSPEAKFSFTADVKAVQYEYIEGHFESDGYSGRTRKYDYNFINNILYGTMRVKDPIITINIDNSIGINLDLSINNVNFCSDYDSNVNMDLSFSGSNNTNQYDVMIQKPTIMGNSYSETIIFNKDNTNLTDILALPIFPGKFEMSTNIQTSENNPTTEFLHKNSKFVVKVKTVFPFVFEENSNYVVYDTLFDININIGDEIMINEDSPLIIDTALIVLNITNGLPLKLTFEPLFYDANNNLIDFDTNEVYNIEAPTVSTEGLVESVHEQRIDIRIKHEHINLLESLNYIVYKMEVNTNDIKTANIKSDDYVELRAGVFVRFDSILKY